MEVNVTNGKIEVNARVFKTISKIMVNGKTYIYNKSHNNVVVLNSHMIETTQLPKAKFFDMIPHKK